MSNNNLEPNQAIPTDDPVIACPFCKWRPVIWLNHIKCGIQGQRPLSKLGSQLRWHVLSTHRKYNDSLADGHVDQVGPEAFARLDCWYKKRKDWKDPIAIWREMYAAIAGLQPDDTSIPDPYWTKEWLRQSAINGQHDLDIIQHAIGDTKLRSEVLILADRIKQNIIYRENSIAKIRQMTETSIAKLQATSDVTISELETESENEILRLKAELRSKFGLVSDQTAILPEIGAFLGDTQDGNTVDPEGDGKEHNITDENTMQDPAYYLDPHSANDPLQYSFQDPAVHASGFGSFPLSDLNDQIHQENAQISFNNAQMEYPMEMATSMVDFQNSHENPIPEGYAQNTQLAGYPQTSLPQGHLYNTSFTHMLGLDDQELQPQSVSFQNKNFDGYLDVNNTATHYGIHATRQYEPSNGGDTFSSGKYPDAGTFSQPSASQGFHASHDEFDFSQ